VNIAALNDAMNAELGKYPGMEQLNHMVGIGL